MAYIFSTDQQSVIDARNSNVLVSAAAGSGKTSVLTERIANRITDPSHPIDIDRILVVTFTNAAAKEMKERIQNALVDKLASDPSNSHLQKQTTLIHGSLITTIHSFCKYLIQNHFHKIGLDPTFRVASEGETDLLKEEVLKDVISRAYASGDEAFFHCVDCYSKKDKDNSLEQSIMALYGYAMSYPWPEKWLEKHMKDYDFSSVSDFLNSDLVSETREILARRTEEALLLANEADQTVSLPDGPYTYADTIESDIKKLSEFKEDVLKLSWDELLLAASSFSFDRLSTKKCDCDPILKDKVKGLRDTYKKLLSSLTEDFLFENSDEMFANMKASGEVVKKVIELVLDFIKTYSDAKRDRGIIDFSDMEHMAVQILVEEYNDDGSYIPTDVALSYRERFEEVMVDEYQDSNLVQELIIRSVSREDSKGKDKNRFMVGDVKQSIYRFRLARPEIFMKKMGVYKKEPDALDRLITLKQNYRSRQSVIDSVNAVFETTMKERLGGVEYDSDARLYKGGEFTPDTDLNRTEVVLVEKPDKSDERRELEIKAIAAKILELKESFAVTDKKTKELRPAKFSDFAVLFRSPSKWLDSLKQSFEEAGIPFHAEGVGAFYETREITEIINFLKVLNNPTDDIAMYATLTSPFGHFSDEECARIEIETDKSIRFLWDKVRKYKEANPEDGKVSAFVERVEHFRALSYVCPIDELISRLLDETGYKHVALALPGGEQRLANVRLLVKKASEYAKTSFYGLFHFLRYVELIKKTEAAEGEANTFDENSDTVRIMSIHKSKGLEFPITIIGGMDDRFNTSDLRSEFVMDIDEGVGASFIDPKRRIKRPTLKKQVIIDKVRRENIGEEIRVLYVAMTRAKEKLVLVGATESLDKLMAGIPDGNNSSYMDFVTEAIASHAKDCFLVSSFDEEAARRTALKSSIDMASKKMQFESLDSDEAMVKDLKERLAFLYPFEGLSKLYTKTTVSELKMAAMDEEEALALHPFEDSESPEYIPVFAGGSLEVKGTDRGTAYHNLLQLLEFETLPKENELSAWFETEKERITSTGKMPTEDVEKVFKGKLLDFLKSDIAKEMSEAAKADNLYKEQPFVIGVSASSVEESFPSDETILVQGVIDVYYIRNGRVTLLDYKTDRVENETQLIDRYKTQLDYYSEAITKLTGLPVDRKLIYSFGLSRVIVVE